MFKTSIATCTAGFAMFAMFFGSGNLVFPLQIGVATTGYYEYASMGLWVTGILVPFLGLMSMVIHGKNVRHYFGRLGSSTSLILIFMMLGLMGPFGVGPRCILVAYGGLSAIFENLSLFWFSLTFCLLTALVIWNHEVIINIIGRILTPILLLSIATIIIFGIYFAAPPTQADMLETDAFRTGIFYGYQTMDLVAAFFFSASIIHYFSDHYKTAHLKLSQMQLAIVASLIGIGLLGFVYTGFVSLGASYANTIAGSAPERMLAHIAEQALGSYALPIIAALVAIACFTTLIVLMDLFAEFLEFDLLQGKVPRRISIAITLSVTFFISLMGFDELAIWIANALYFIYPALIAFAIASILEDLYKVKIVKHVFYGVLILTFITKIGF